MNTHARHVSEVFNACRRTASVVCVQVATHASCILFSWMMFYHRAAAGHIGRRP